ncbi:hypothetical protein DFH07DRAFT_722836, partial [Mycena maculata]
DQSKDELEALKRRILVLEETGKWQATEKCSHDNAVALKNAQDEASSLNYQLEEAKTSFQRIKQELKEAQERLAKSKSVSQGKTRDESAIDVFDHRLDQVSEAHIKSGVESLNDSVDNLVTILLETGDQLVEKHSDLVRHPPKMNPRDDNTLLLSLAQQPLTSENQGLLLDAMLHHQVHKELYELFFPGDVASHCADPQGWFGAVFEELTRRERWTVVQRWHAITATSLLTLFNETHFTASIPTLTKSIIALLAWAHGLSHAEFEPMSDMIHSGLLALYKEANNLAILARRDILSVHMTIDSMTVPVFNPQYANAMWPEMGARAGDDVVAQYRFGLLKLREDGEISCMVKPEVVTTALIRETSKN